MQRNCVSVLYILNTTLRHRAFAMEGEFSSTCICTIFLLHFLRSFGGFYNTKSVGFWCSSPDPDGGACGAPPYPLAGRDGCPPPAPSPGRLCLHGRHCLQSDHFLYGGDGPAVSWVKSTHIGSDLIGEQGAEHTCQIQLFAMDIHVPFGF